MINGKTVLAIVPARKGSKRFKLKNFRIFRGKPLFYWPLSLSEKSKYIDNIVFTTDSQSMYSKAKKNFKIIDYIRPKNLAKSELLKSENMKNNANQSLQRVKDTITSYIQSKGTHNYNFHVSYSFYYYANFFTFNISFNR